MPDEETQSPPRVRYQVPLTLLPFVMGLATAIPLWGREAPPIFFSTAAETIALGAVGMALQGRFFRVGALNRTLWGGVSNATSLIAAGVGLGFAFGALIRGDAGDPHVAMTMGGLVVGVSSFVVQALFGTPGSSDPDD